MKSVRPFILNLPLLLALLCDLCCFVKVVSGLCAMFVLSLSRFVESLSQQRNWGLKSAAPLEGRPR